MGEFFTSRASADLHSNSLSRHTLEQHDDSQLLGEVKLNGFAGEAMQTIEHANPYGFSTYPKGPSMVGGVKRYAVAFMSFLTGNRSHGVAQQISDRRFRLYNKKEGEVALHDDQGQWIYLTRNGVLAKAPNANSFTIQIDAQQQQQQQQQSGSQGGSQGQGGNAGMGQDASKVPQPVCKIVVDKSRIHFYDGASEVGYYDISQKMWVMLTGNGNRAVVHPDGVKIKYGTGGPAIFVDKLGCWSTVAMDVKGDPIPNGSP
jgi:phage gp45-like